MVNDPHNEPFISWLEDGDGFQVLQPRELASQILPNYFNGTMCSFIRQLNLYGFSKVGDEFAFKHHDGFFKRGQENLLQYIERRKNVRSKSRHESDKSGEPNKQQKISKKPVKSQETKPEPETDQDPLAQLIHSHNAHDFMINWLTQELHHQQREIGLLREQLVSLTQTLRYQANTVPAHPLQENYDLGQIRAIYGNQSTNRNIFQLYSVTPATNSMMTNVPHGNYLPTTNGNFPFFPQKISQNGFHPQPEMFQNGNTHLPPPSISNKISQNGFHPLSKIIQNGNPNIPEMKNNGTENSTQNPEFVQTTPPLNAEYLDFEQYPENIFSGLNDYDLIWGKNLSLSKIIVMFLI